MEEEGKMDEGGRDEAEVGGGRRKQKVGRRRHSKKQQGGGKQGSIMGSQRRLE